MANGLGLRRIRVGRFQHLVLLVLVLAVGGHQDKPRKDPDASQRIPARQLQVAGSEGPDQQHAERSAREGLEGRVRQNKARSSMLVGPSDQQVGAHTIEKHPVHQGKHGTLWHRPR